MQTRNLGSSSLRVSVVGLGCNNFGWRIGPEETRKVVHKAIDAGITLFDTADTYGNKGGSETLLGEVLGARRKDIVLATKFGMPMQEKDDPNERRGSRAYIISALEASLKRLKTDWIDLYQLHRPDPKTPMEETLRALDDLVRQGKVRHIGCSNLPAWQVADAHWISKTQELASFVSCQDEYSLLVRQIEKELIPAAKTYGLGVLPYFPLASGLLTGKYRRGTKPPEDTRLAGRADLAGRYINDANWNRVEQLEAFARGHKHSLLDLAFSWLAAQPQVASVIAGATKPEQVEQNVKSASWQLSADDLKEIDRISGA